VARYADALKYYNLSYELPRGYADLLFLEIYFRGSAHAVGGHYLDL
jgi:hypothetical protein